MDEKIQNKVNRGVNWVILWIEHHICCLRTVPLLLMRREGTAVHLKRLYIARGYRVFSVDTTSEGCIGYTLLMQLRGSMDASLYTI